MPEFKKDSDDSKDSNDNPPKIDPDNPKPEDIKNLQKALSERDLELKTALEKNKNFDDAEKKKIVDDKKKADEKKSESELEMQKLREDLKTVTDSLNILNKGNRRDELAKEYPDIEPDLLIDKTDERIKEIVEKQRSKNKEIFGDSKFFIKPAYESEDDIQKEIDDVKTDKKLHGDQAAIKVLRLMREKLNFKK